MIVAFVVLGWSIIELLNLARVHTIGPEVYGVLVAALSVGAGVVSVVLLRSDERRPWYVLPLSDYGQWSLSVESPAPWPTWLDRWRVTGRSTSGLGRSAHR